MVRSRLSFKRAPRGSQGEKMSTPAPKFREKAQVLDESALDRALTRIAHEILEKNAGAADLAFVGIRTRGVTLAQRLAEKIARIDGTPLPVGAPDITLYRDDLDMRGAPEVRGSDIPLYIKRVPALRGMTLVNLCYEASTRARASFEIAGKCLSADAINFSASGSSAAKCETSFAPAKSTEARAPYVVLFRRSSPGAAHL